MSDQRLARSAAATVEPDQLCIASMAIGVSRESSKPPLILDDEAVESESDEMYGEDEKTADVSSTESTLDASGLGEIMHPGGGGALLRLGGERGAAKTLEYELPPGKCLSSYVVELMRNKRAAAAAHGARRASSLTISAISELRGIKFDGTFSRADCISEFGVTDTMDYFCSLMCDIVLSKEARAKLLFRILDEGLFTIKAESLDEDEKTEGATAPAARVIALGATHIVARFSRMDMERLRHADFILRICDVEEDDRVRLFARKQAAFYQGSVLKILDLKRQLKRKDEEIARLTRLTSSRRKDSRSRFPSLLG